MAPAGDGRSAARPALLGARPRGVVLGEDERGVGGPGAGGGGVGRRPVVIEEEEAKLTCACGASSDDPDGWERGDFEDRCPECFLADPEEEVDTGSSAAGLLEPEALMALGALGASAEEDAEEGD